MLLHFRSARTVAAVLSLLPFVFTATKGRGMGDGSITVALAQMWSEPSIDANVGAMEKWIARAAAADAQLIAFPECAVTSYNVSYIKTVTRQELESAESRIAAACEAHGITAIVGSPGYYSPGDRGYNSDSAGKIAWAAPGSELSVFSVAGVNVSVMICHEVRFPELTRLPVMAGAQVQARAVENVVWVAHVNTPYAKGCTEHEVECSHGQSLFASPYCNTSIPIASITDEELAVHTLDTTQAHRSYAVESLRRDYGWGKWWSDAVARVGYAQ
eukprot:gene3917-3955_t